VVVPMRDAWTWACARLQLLEGALRGEAAALEVWRAEESVRAVPAPQGDAAPGLNLSAVNLARCTAPDGFNHPLASWSAAEWTNAVAGEAGEACNLAKKLIRHRDGVPGNKKPEDKDQDSLRRRIAEELADVVIYCDLAMASVGYDFATVIRDVFNRKSQELGSPYVLGGAASSSGSAP
jgi:NTP pyrophosphatase (non-canonical NTP hydrolase)